MNRLNLFDSFCYNSEDENIPNYLEKSITNNIHDILQNKATIGLEELPFNFGIKDISGQTTFGEEIKLQLESYIEERIKLFEPRIMFVSAKIKQPKTYGYILVKICGKYVENNHQNDYLAFFEL